MPTALLDPLLLGAMNTSMNTIIKAAIIGLAFQGLVLGGVLLQTSNYFRLFPTDPRAYKVLVTLGTLMCIAQFCISTAASLNLVTNALDFTGYWMTDLKLNMVITLFLCVFRGVAAVYFSRRMWGLTGKRIYILIGLVVLILTTTAFGITTTVYGFHPPEVTSITHGPRLLLWFDKIGMFAKAWAITCPILDVVICLTTVTLLLRSKSTLGGSEKTLMKKVVILTTETMLPPAIMSIGILLFFEINGIFGSYDRSLVWVIGPTYYLTILHSLVARQQLAAIIYPISMDGIMPHKNSPRPGDMSRSSSSRRLNPSAQFSSSNSGQVEMTQMELSYDNRMSDHTFGRAQSEARRFEHDRRASWYESGQSPVKGMQSDLDEWKGSSRKGSLTSDKSWKDNTLIGSPDDSPPFARVQQRPYRYV